MGQRMPRILLAKLGHGHKEALLNLAKRLGDAGFEIVYTELEDPAAIVGTAIQESVDHIGITVLEDGDISNVRRIKGLLDQGEESH
ncbi:MAG: methylmalonyl-CoA mutase, partial [Deltaproteobacteria bacterium]